MFTQKFIYIIFLDWLVWNETALSFGGPIKSCPLVVFVCLFFLVGWLGFFLVAILSVNCVYVSSCTVGEIEIFNTEFYLDILKRTLNLLVRLKKCVKLKAVSADVLQTIETCCL